MARLDLTAPAHDDLDRLFDFVAAADPAAALAAWDAILDALHVLERHPHIGRPAESNLRELVISHGKTGYVALYEFVESEDVVLVLAIRHQREMDFPTHDES